MISSIRINIIFELSKVIFTYLESTIVRYFLTALNGKLLVGIGHIYDTKYDAQLRRNMHFHCVIESDMKSAQNSGQ